MNATRPLFPIAARAARRLAALAGCGVLSACASVPGDTKVDPSSPVAAEVAQRSHEAGKFPSFASIPSPPKDVRPAPQYGTSANRIVAARDALIAATEPNTWTLSGTDEFAEKARRDAGPTLEPAKPGDAEAFARELRERATPPPPR